MGKARETKIRPADAIRFLLLASPVAALVLLLRHPWLDPHLEDPRLHFVIVSITALIGIVLATLVLIAAHRLNEPRTFLLGLSFLALAGFFFVHGFLTPGVLMPFYSRGIGWAPWVGFLLSAVFLAFSSRERPGREPAWFRARSRVLLGLVVVWAVFFAAALAFPDMLKHHPTSLSGYPGYVAGRVGVTPVGAQARDHRSGQTGYGTRALDYGTRASEYGTQATEHGPASGYGPGVQQGAQAPSEEEMFFPWIAAAILGVSVALYLPAVLRYLRNYRLTGAPLHATVVAGMVLLTESELSFFFASTWRISWWEYHALLLLGFATILYGVLMEYQRGTTLTQTIRGLILDGSVDALERTYSEAVTALITAVEARDLYTKGHSEKVARRAVRIGERLGVPPERLRELYQAGLVHDVGKIAIPDAILNKPGPLTPAEFEAVKAHPLRSEEIVSRIPSLRPTLGAIRWHHERLDGSGYPDGLRGAEIPLSARILAVADVFDAMTSGRSYRPAHAVQAALAYLEEHAGSLFDERCVAALKETVDDPMHDAEPSLAELRPAVSSR